MKQTWASAVIVGLLVCTAVLGAQSNPTHRTTSRAPKAQKEAITVTGCLQDAGTAGTKAAKYPSFMLADADNGNGSYVLQGMDLTREIGQKVEVTATEMPAPRSRATRGTSGSTSANENPPAKHLWVSSVKEISANCSGGAGQ